MDEKILLLVKDLIKKNNLISEICNFIVQNSNNDHKIDLQDILSLIFVVNTIKHKLPVYVYNFVHGGLITLLNQYECSIDKSCTYKSYNSSQLKENNFDKFEERVNELVENFLSKHNLED